MALDDRVAPGFLVAPEDGVQEALGDLIGTLPVVAAADARVERREIAHHLRQDVGELTVEAGRVLLFLGEQAFAVESEAPLALLFRLIRLHLAAAQARLGVAQAGALRIELLGEARSSSRSRVRETRPSRQGAYNMGFGWS